MTTAGGWILAIAMVVTASAKQHDELVKNEDGGSGSFKIEGRVLPPEPTPQNWHWNTRVLIDGGRRVAFLQEDNSFVASGLPPGSYLVEVANPDYRYEPTRVDITSKGKMRARKVNNVQPNSVNQLPYPLKMKPLQKMGYFEKREEWRISDMLMNPMVLMMVLPLLLITVLPQMMSDPETQKEVQEMQRNMQMQQNQMPEVSEVFANLFGGGQSQQPKKRAVKARKS